MLLLTINTKTLLGVTGIAALTLVAIFAITSIGTALAGGPFATLERDTLFVTDFKLNDGQVAILYDNAGTATDSVVEVTWRLDDTCALLYDNDLGPGITLVPFVNDGVLGGNPNHQDAAIDAIALAGSGDRCFVNPSHGEYISITTVGTTNIGP